MPADSMYDDMPLGADEDGDGDTPEEEKAEPKDLDEEFEMHAKDAGFETPEKAMALKMAIERCADLRDQKMYEPKGDSAGAGDEEDAEA